MDTALRGGTRKEGKTGSGKASSRVVSGRTSPTRVVKRIQEDRDFVSSIGESD